MPTYEYTCRTQGRHFEVKHGFHDAPPSECPNCGSADIRKIFSPVGIVFKGSGFYKTDSRAGATSSGESTKSDGSSSSDSSTSKSSSSESSSEKKSSDTKSTDKKTASASSSGS